MIGHLLIGLLLRLYLIKYIPNNVIINDNVFSNAFDSRSSLTEAVALHNDGVSPYAGNIFHGTPLMLRLVALADQLLSQDNLAYFLAFVDVFIGVLLHQIVRKMTFLMSRKVKKRNNFSIQYSTTKDDVGWKCGISIFFYILNPVAILSCSFRGFGTLYNLILTLFVYFIVHEQFVLGSLFMTFCIYENIYGLVFIFPAVVLCKKMTASWTKVFLKIFLPSFLVYGGLIWTSFAVEGSFDFIDSTIGHIFYLKETQPSLSLFWSYSYLIMPFFRVIWDSFVPVNVLVMVITLTLTMREDPSVLLVVIVYLYGFINPVGTATSGLVGNGLLPAVFHLFRGYPQVIILTVINLTFPIIMIGVGHAFTVCMSMNIDYYFNFTAIYCAFQAVGVTDLINMYFVSRYFMEKGVAKDRTLEYQDNLNYANINMII